MEPGREETLGGGYSDLKRFTVRKSVAMLHRKNGNMKVDTCRALKDRQNLRLGSAGITRYTEKRFSQDRLDVKTLRPYSSAKGCVDTWGRTIHALRLDEAEPTNGNAPGA